jgi:hypothetical protein
LNLGHQVEMIRHQAEQVQADVEVAHALLQSRQESSLVRVIEVDGLARVPVNGDVVDGNLEPVVTLG